jgi:hypothetical protein
MRHVFRFARAREEFMNIFVEVKRRENTKGCVSSYLKQQRKCLNEEDDV